MTDATVVFYYYCPSEVLASGATSVPSLQSWLATNDSATQTALGAYLMLTGRALEEVELSISSYLASGSSQPLPALIADMAASSAALKVPVLTDSCMCQFVLRGGYIELGLGSGATRTATPQTAGMLVHLSAGMRVVVQIVGDPLTDYYATVTSVSSPSVTFADGSLPTTSELIIKAVVVNDAERMREIIVFRQYYAFEPSGSTADDSTFNPSLYLMLYRAVSPEIIGMTAQQLFLSYTSNPGRVGCVRDLRIVEETSPVFSSVEVTSLLNIAGTAGLELGGVILREVATYNDVAQNLSDANSDTALMTAKGVQEAILVAIAGLGANLYTLELRAGDAQIGTLSVQTSLTIPGTFTATQSDFSVFVPLTAPSLVAALATLDSAHVSGSLTAQTVDAQSVQANSVSAGTAHFVSILVDTTATCGSVVASSMSVSGSADVAGTLTSTDIVSSGSLSTGSISTSGSLQVSGPAALVGVSASTLSVSGLSELSSADIANGSLVVLPGGGIQATVPIRAVGVTATDMDTVNLNASSVYAHSGSFADLTSQQATLAAASIDELTVGKVVGEFTGASLIGTNRLYVSGPANIGDVIADDVTTNTLEASGQTTLSGLLHVVRDATFDAQLTAYRLLSTQLNVSGDAVIGNLAVPGTGVFGVLQAVGDVSMAENLLVAGAIDCNSLSVRIQFSAPIGVFSGGVAIPNGDLNVPNGQAQIGGNLVVGGVTAFGNTVTVNNGLTVSGVSSLTGELSVSGDVVSNGSVQSQSVESQVGSFQSLAVQGTVSVEGELSATSVFVSGDVASNGSYSAGGSITAGGDANVGGDLNVAGASEFTGAVDIGGDVVIDGTVISIGNAEFQNDLTVSGICTCSVLNSPFIDTSKIQCMTLSATDLAVDGHLGADTLTVNECATVGGEFRALSAVFSQSLVARDLSISDNIMTGSLFGSSVTTGNLTAASADIQSLVAESGTFNGDVVVAAGNVSAAGDLAVGGDVRVAGKLRIDGLVDFGGQPVTVSSSLSAASAIIDVASIQTCYVQRIGIQSSSATAAVSPSPSDLSAILTRLNALEAEAAALRALLGQ